MMRKESKTLRDAVCVKPENIICIIISLAIYIANKLFLINATSGEVHTFCQCYLNDMVCPLFFLGYSQTMLIWAGYEIVSYKGCLLLGMLGGVVWEYGAPFINPKAVSDPWDLLCYFIGTTTYFCSVYRRNIVIVYKGEN